MRKEARWWVKSLWTEGAMHPKVGPEEEPRPNPGGLDAGGMREEPQADKVERRGPCGQEVQG